MKSTIEAEKPPEFPSSAFVLCSVHCPKRTLEGTVCRACTSKDTNIHCRKCSQATIKESLEKIEKLETELKKLTVAKTTNSTPRATASSTSAPVYTSKSKKLMRRCDHKVRMCSSTTKSKNSKVLSCSQASNTQNTQWDYISAPQTQSKASFSDFQYRVQFLHMMNPETFRIKLKHL